MGQLSARNRVTPPLEVFLSIIIPAYNEALRLPRTLEILAEYCAQLAYESEVIAVVEKSTDQTVAAASAVAARHPSISVIANEVRRGKGYALRTGVGVARGEIVLLMDADRSVPLEFVGLFVDGLRDDPSLDLLIGSRQHADSVIDVRQSWFRESLGKVFNMGVRLLAASRFRDTQCGFKAFRREAAKAIFSRQTVDGFACDVEILLLAERMGFVVRDRPVRWINSPDSRVRIVRDSFGMLIDLIRIRSRVRRTLAERPFPVPDRRGAAMN